MFNQLFFFSVDVNWQIFEEVRNNSKIYKVLLTHFMYQIFWQGNFCLSDYSCPLWSAIDWYISTCPANAWMNRITFIFWVTLNITQKLCSIDSIQVVFTMYQRVAKMFVFLFCPEHESEKKYTFFILYFVLKLRYQLMQRISCNWRTLLEPLPLVIKA